MAEIDFKLPPGWGEHYTADGPREYRARTDGLTGMLHVSELTGRHLEFVRKYDDLAALAVDIGTRLGTQGQNWGKAGGSQQGPCAVGRFGFAVFHGGEYPAMLLWVTVSDDAAWLWTWWGPNPASPEVKQALLVVLEAHQRRTTSSR
jgi:hypothetical protein